VLPATLERREFEISKSDRDCKLDDRGLAGRGFEDRERTGAIGRILYGTVAIVGKYRLAGRDLLGRTGDSNFDILKPVVRESSR
jgi:hypothetical protein